MWYRKKDYEWEVHDFYEVSEKLRELRSMIREDVPTYEDFEIAIDEIIQRQNRMFRALARELRRCKKHEHP